MKQKRTAIIAGATGLVGSNLADLLVLNESYDKVYTVGRSSLNNSSDKIEFIKFDFNDEESYLKLPKVDAIFCALGTTINKAGSQEKFKEVDFTYPKNLGDWAKKMGVSQYHLVSSLGADSNSNIFYSKVKGQLEDALTALELKALRIYQPSIILGERNETRIGESLGKFFMTLARPLFIGSLKKYKGIQARTIAKAMVVESLKEIEGVKTYESDEVEELARVDN